MQSQFFYTRREAIPAKEGETIQYKEMEDSFNINKIVRSLSTDDSRLLILLDDLHERVQKVPEVNVKTNKIIGYKRERDTFQSEIYLEKQEDIERFKKLTSIG